jgi:hypothetical protein
VLVTAGAGAFILSPYNHIVPVSAGVRTQVRQIATKAGVNLDASLAPSAGLARVEVPNRPTAEVVPSYQPRSSDEGLRELLAMQTRSAPTSSPGCGQLTAEWVSINQVSYRFGERTRARRSRAGAPGRCASSTKPVCRFTISSCPP